MTYKLLALDIDRTVTGHNLDVCSPRVYESLQKASKLVTIIFVTARSVTQLNSFLANQELPAGYHAAENGAKVLNLDGSYAYDLHIPDIEVQQIVNATSSHFVEIGFLSDTDWYEDTDPVSAEENITGLSFTCSSLEEAKNLEKSLETLPHKYSTYVGAHWTNDKNLAAVLLFHKDGTKGFAMRYIQEKLGISKEETIAVGDGATDISMFDAAGLRVAMANSEEIMLENADYICPAWDKDGVVDVIERYIISN